MLAAKGNIIIVGNKRKVINQTKQKNNLKQTQKASNQPQNQNKMKQNKKTKTNHHKHTSSLHFFLEYLWLWSGRRHCSAQLCNGI